ncbi:MAG: acetyltransferase [Pseudomonadota bacterium]
MHLLKGIAAITYIAINTFVVWIPLAWWIIKRPFTSGESRSKHAIKMDKIIWWWTANNRRMIKALNLSQVEVDWKERDTMSRDNWYVVVSNHQSWTDIVLLQSFLYGEIPPLKFFTKQQLIWVPGIGVAMYVLGFPYVKRVTKAQIKANPKLRNADRDNTKAACEGFKNHPTSILNFLEGTRYTPEKHATQNSEFQHLLRPKIGGLDYVLEGMDGYLHRLLDVTIVYPDGVPTFWEFLQGKCPRVHMQVQPHVIPEELSDPEHKRRPLIAAWVKEMWNNKDAHIAGHTQTGTNAQDALVQANET